MKKVIDTTAKLTVNQLVDLLTTLVGSVFCSMESITAPDLNVKHRETKQLLPWLSVTRWRYFTAQLGYNLPKQVNNNSKKEGISQTFVAEPHKWARRIIGALAAHKKHNIELMKHNIENILPEYLYVAYSLTENKDSHYMADGNIIDKSELLPYMPPIKNWYGKQAADKKVVVQYIKLLNIKKLSFENNYNVVIE